MANKIDQEIEQLAEKMTKSVADGRQTLFDTIMNLGPEGLKKALPLLSPEQRTLVEEAVEEMLKAAHKPEPTDDASKLTPEKTQTKHAKMKAESESGSDDQDEKLMEDKNKDIKHQGGPADKPAGWEGQVIKSGDLNKAKEPPHKGPHGGIIIGHTRDGKPIYEHAGHDSHKDFSEGDHHEASEMHERLAGKHQEVKMRSPYASVEGLQSMGGKKRKFKEAKAQYEKDAGDHELHRESSAYHRRMADFKSGRDIGDLKPEDHKAQADRHMERINKLHELRKCGYGPMMKDMGQGGAGDYGMALSMSKSIKPDDIIFSKSLFSNCLKVSDAKDAPKMTKEQCRGDIEWKLRQMKDLRELAWMIEDEAPEAKEMMEKKYAKLKSEIKDLCEKHGDLKKAYENSTTLIRSEEKMEKKQGVPKGVDPEKWERRVKEVKKKPGIDNPYAIVNAAMAKKSFAEVEEHAREEGAKDPKAVAAAVGFKKLGKEEMERRAQAGKKKSMDKSYGENLTPEQKLEKDKMKKAKKIVKSIKKIAKMCKALGMTKAQMKEAITKAGGDLKLVKAELKEKMNPEQNQVEIKTQDESTISAPKPDQSKGDLEIKPDETADEALKKLPKVQKALAPWQMKSSIAAGTLGRNTHWDVDAFIEKSEAEKQEIIKKGGYFGEKEVEELKKSQDPNKKADINDMIEKGMDYSVNEISRLEAIRDHKRDGVVVSKGDYDGEIARSMGLTKEDFEKIFGSNEDY